MSFELREHSLPLEEADPNRALGSVGDSGRMS
jgi:hypothetical protein